MSISSIFARIRNALSPAALHRIRQARLADAYGDLDARIHELVAMRDVLRQRITDTGLRSLEGRRWKVRRDTYTVATLNHKAMLADYGVEKTADLPERLVCATTRVTFRTKQQARNERKHRASATPWPAKAK
jgi:hypothetical protein